MKNYYFGKEPSLALKYSACVKTGYFWNSFVYLGKDSDPDVECRQPEERVGKSGAVAVLSAIANNLLAYGYKLFVHNWCTSQSLFEYLLENQTDATGTARRSCINLAKSFKGKKLDKEEHVF